MTQRSDDIAGTIGSVPRCRTCGSERVVKDAWVCWNSEFGMWDVETVHDHGFCHACEKTRAFTWSKQELPPNQRIRELNDQFRKHGVGKGSIVVTRGIQEKGRRFTMDAVKAVRNFDDFSNDNDPWGEHDFGALEIEDEKVFFKIDYYDPSLEKGSENPANEGCTHRVLTIMLASEY